MRTPEDEAPLALSATGGGLLDRYDDQGLLDLRAGLDGMPAERRGAAVAALAELAAGAAGQGSVPSPAGVA